MERTVVQDMYDGNEQKSDITEANNEKSKQDAEFRNDSAIIIFHSFNFFAPIRPLK